ncbi:DNA polymerase epsilon catalytic subunit, partial [Terramyces sp. JEL0728]
MEKQKKETDFKAIQKRDEIDEKMGFPRFVEGEKRLGWLVNINDTIVDTGVDKDGSAGVDLYFLQNDGSSFKATVIYQPYFYVLAKDGFIGDVEEFLRRKFEKKISLLELVHLDDLDLKNHLTGNKRKALKLSFHNNVQFRQVKQFLSPLVNSKKEGTEAIDQITGLREYDLIDLRVGLWYNVEPKQGVITIEPRPDIVTRADPVVLAFDIETTKLPLKFPDSAIDSIMMISYMIDGQGYLITNRDIVSQDIEDFEFTPKPEYQGSFTIFNEDNEVGLLKRFFEHIQQAKPHIFATYNGDFFDWPFIEARATLHSIDMYEEIGFCKNNSGEYLSSYASHMDCFCWVKRDSYLPQGSQNLKAVATYKLGYNPVELDPEDMTRYAAEKPQILSQYSVSDAVATYYLYMKYVNPFTFSLCNIIPMHPDDVLRRGSGTLCEHLLMVQAFKANVLMPNKHVDKGGNFFDGHLLNSETYVGGHVEALEAGVFRSDFPTKFKLSSEGFQSLIDEIDNALKFSIEKEGKIDLKNVLNYDEVRADIVKELENLRDHPNRTETPSIYHLDVGAMYPNIILTNRLQPDAIVTDKTCASCDFNQGENSTCQRKMPWSWRGEYFLSSKGEYNMLKNQLEQEKIQVKEEYKSFHELPHFEQDSFLKKRMSEYTRKVYGKTYETKVVEKESIVCQRENPFYVNTVRNFRDRRYEYKALLKSWKKKLEQAIGSGDAAKIDEASKMTVIFDSLQTAHKCILNSFYGYVMRKGARWYSMEMAGIVCLTGAKIIQLARSRVEQIGRPLELDTDGIWCMLPKSFPENFTFKLQGDKSYFISYPCVMLNHLVHDKFTNDQYQDLVDEKTFEYQIKKENSIFFEVDGPYKAMILPASTEQDKLLKKRYAVFNHDGSLAELKGFELKRRGELKLIKNFQSSIFKVFLEGDDLNDCYKQVAAATDSWLDILYTKGRDLTDNELFDLVSENRSMSKSLEEYGQQKSTSITTAKRLAELLGDQMVKDRGLNCKFVIVSKPADAPVSERAIPIAIFQSDESVKRHYLRKWLKDTAIQDEDIRDLIDWEYYLERFGGVIQKLITIPAAAQNVENPIPRIKHPDWLLKRLSIRDDKMKQISITDMFARTEKPVFEATDQDNENIVDIEELATTKTVRLANGKRHIKTQLEPLTRKKKKRKHLPPATVSDNPHCPFSEYTNWLQHQKKIWFKRLAVNKQISQSKKKKGISSFFTSTIDILKSQCWEILQISETDSFGVFRVFAIINDQLESFELEIPRIIIANCKTLDPTFLHNPDIFAKKINRTLPRNHSPLHLFQLEMTEYFYKSNPSLFSTVLTEKEIAGIYETQVPLILRGLLNLGTFLELADPNQMFDRSMLLKLDQVSKVTKPRKKYLQKGIFNSALLYHCQTTNRQMFALYVPFSETLQVFFVDPGNNVDAIPNIKRLYSTAFESSISNREQDAELFFEYSENIKVEATVYTNEKEAHSQLNSILLDIKTQSKMPLVLAIQSPKSTKYFRQNDLSALYELPVLNVPIHKSDSAFPAIGWQAFAVNRMFGHLFHISEFICERIDIARYSDIPLCNIEYDYAIYLSDLAFARILVRTDNVLWCSASSKPDLGGKENEDNSCNSLDIENPEVNNKGAYDSICIELGLWDLSLNTLIKSMDQNGELISAAAAPSKASIHLLDAHFSADNLNTKTDSDQSPHNAIASIRTLVKSWLADLRKGNRFASHFLEHLHRWITTNSAYFYDGLIVSHIHTLMTRNFSALLEEFDQLGSSVVYASFDKLVLATSKKSLSAGIGYISYVLASISKNPEFMHLEIKPTGFYDYLLWCDQFNFGSLAFQDVESIESSNNESTVDMKWNISDFLPSQVRTSFLKTIAEFLYMVREFKSQELCLEENLNSLIDMELKRKLFSLVESLHRKRLLDEDLNPETAYTFPKLPGICRNLHNPALEFIKMVAMVFSLDRKLEIKVRVMKRDLLKLIDIKEFSRDAVFHYPCEKYILPQIICEFCNHCCDLDLTRKTELNADENITERSFLGCEGCGMMYDKEDIEQRLIEQVALLLTKWQLQDLQCKKCKMIKAEELKNQCYRCTGELATVLDRSRFERQLVVLGNLADYFHLEMLQDHPARRDAIKTKMFISAKVTLLLLITPFTAAQQQSLCDKYTTALFKDNTEDNQLKLLTTLVNRVVGGNFTATPNNQPVTGILVKGTINGEPVDMLPKFIGTSGPTTNINGVATAGINFLDGGGADALKKGLPASDPNTRQFKLLTHLYGVFGSLTGCSKMGGSVFPNYAGNPSMTDTHRFMNINKPTLDFFIDQVGQAAISLGVTKDDATAVGGALNALFNTQCAKPTQLTPQSQPLPQGF